MARFALGWGCGFAGRRVQNLAGRLFCCRVVDDFCGYQKSRPAGFWPPQVAYLPALFPHRKTLTSQPERPSSFSSMQNANLTAGAPKSPLHNSANAVMRMVVSCERSE